MISADIEYHYIVQPEIEQNNYVHGDSPNYSPSNITIYQGPVPKWVQSVPMPQEKKAKEFGDLNNRNLLFDSQINIAEKGCYCHYVYKIWNAYDAMKLSNFSVSFDPAHEKIILHSCFIEREGVRINKLDMNELRVMQEEDELDQEIYQASMLALLFLEDIRPGDVLDYSFSFLGLNHFNWPFSNLISLQFHRPWEKVYYRIVKAPGHSYQIQYQPTAWQSYLSEDDQAYVWQIEPCPAYHFEKNEPPGYRPFAFFEISEARNWNEIARVEAPFYELNTSFAQDPEVIKLVNSWKSASSLPEEQALAALRFVQDEIRYLGLEDNLKGIIPSAPLVTLQRRFGDCKGKTQLFRAFLSALDIPSHACLVNVYLQKELKNGLPKPYFNHVITCIDLPDQPLFVDPTMIFQGGSLRDSYLPYGYALILSEKTQDLTPIPELVVHPEITCSTSLTLNSRDQVELQMTVHSYGIEANNCREIVNALGVDDFFEPIQQDLISQFDSVRSKESIQIEDDRAHNHTTITATYVLDDPWIFDREEEAWFAFDPLFLSQYIIQTIDNDRETPLYVPHVRIKETISFGQGFQLETDSATIENETFTLKIDAAKNRVDYDLVSHRETIPADEVKSFSDELDEAHEAMIFFVKKD